MFSIFNLLLIVSLTSCSSGKIFTIEPENKLVPLSSKAKITFPCTADLDDVEYSWTKDDSPVDTSDGSRFNMFKGTLEISNPQQSDEGQYQCIARSDIGRAESNYARLTFAYVNPFLPQAFTTVTILEGMGIAIPCAGAQYAPEKTVGFYWFFDERMEVAKPPGNANLYVSQKTGTMYIANANVDQSDTLFCNAKSVWTNSDGNHVTAKGNGVKLQVSIADTSFPPEFLLSPQDVVAIRGGDVLMECFASGEPTPTLTWSKRGGEMPINKTITPAGQLILHNINEDHEGTYVCTASNGVGSDIEGTSTLTLQYKPQWTSELIPSEADLSTTATLRCGATAVPAATLSWLKNTETIADGGRMSITSDGMESVLEISNVDAEDQAIYQCVASNVHGSVLSSAVLSIRSYPPEFLSELADITSAFIGKEAKIAADVSSAPPASISWMKDGVNLTIDESKYFIHTSGSLHIYNVERSDAGDYKCRAANLLGIASSEGTLQVFDATVISESPDDLELVAGDTEEARCKAQSDSNLAMKWKWKQDGQELNSFSMHYNPSGNTLLILDVTSEQNGTYSCCAITDADEVCKEFVVVVTAPPDAPTNVKVGLVTSVSQALTWTIPDDNGARITEYVIMGKKIDYDDEWSTIEPANGTITSSTCTITNLLPHVAYSYKVAAHNKIGLGSFSEESLREYTLEGAPVKAPTGIGSSGGNPGQLIVTWEPLHQMYCGAEDVDYHVGVQKLPDVENIPPMINLTDSSSLPESSEPWVYKTVIGRSSNRAVFTVDPQEIFEPYYAKVQAINPKGDGPYSALRVVHTAELAPSEAPTGFKPAWILAYSALLRWLPLQDENGFTKGYHVRVCDIIQTPDCQIGSKWINATTLNAKPEVLVEGLQPQKAYKVSIAGFNTGGLGPWSDWEDSIFVAQEAPPDKAPTDVQIYTKKGELHVSWKPITSISSIQGYKVQFWLTNETENERIDKSAASPFTYKLPVKADYNVWVRAFNAGGEGRPTAPQIVSAKEGTTAKYQGDNANTIKGSCTLAISVATMWSIRYILL